MILVAELNIFVKVFNSGPIKQELYSALTFVTAIVNTVVSVFVHHKL